MQKRERDGSPPESDINQKFVHFLDDSDLGDLLLTWGALIRASLSPKLEKFVRAMTLKMPADDALH